MDETLKFIILTLFTAGGVYVFIGSINHLNSDSTKKEQLFFWTFGLLSILVMMAMGYFVCPWMLTSFVDFIATKSGWAR